MTDKAYADRAVQTEDSRAQKYSTLQYTRPQSNLTKRVCSLPENSPVYRVKSVRVASMPECIRPSDNSATFDSAETSFSCDSLLRHTPSPPSSPESIMIIGNDVQVPNFLNGRIAPHNLDRDDGWVDWTNSPPKPIPALHGPSSLPYARCPSGAEGTIIESDDLPRMIWGLATDNSQPRTTEKSLKMQNDSVITLSQDHLFCPEPAGNPKQQQWSSLEPDVIHLDKLAAFNHANGLGLDWQTLRRLNLHEPRDFRPVSSLKPSAPTFVPAHQTFDEPSSRIFIEPRSGQSILPSRQRSALELARQYQAKQRAQVSVLPTPPSSSSPQWSSYYPPANPDHFGMTPFEDQQVDNHYLPASSDHFGMTPFEDQVNKHYSSNHDDEELRNFIYEHLDFNKRAPVGFQQERTLLSSPISRQYYPDPIMSPPHPGPPPNSPLPPVPIASKPSRIDVKSRLRAMLAAAPPSPPSPEAHRPVPPFPMPTGRQPRSIPFARLMQRRLASVPEEDYGESQPQTPPPPAPAPAPDRIDTWLKGPGASPSSNPFSSNQARFPDISNSMHSRTPSPEKASLKKRTGGGGGGDSWRRTSAASANQVQSKKDGSSDRRDREGDKENGGAKVLEKGSKRKAFKKSGGGSGGEKGNALSRQSAVDHP